MYIFLDLGILLLLIVTVGFTTATVTSWLYREAKSGIKKDIDSVKDWLHRVVND